MKTIAERLADAESALKLKKDALQAIIDGAAEDNDRDLDESEAQQADELRDDIAKLSTKHSNLAALDASAVTAKSVNGERPRATVAATAKTPTETGIGFARMVMCFAAAKGNRFEAIEVAKQRYPHEKAIQTFLKAPVSGGTTMETEWAGNLVEPTNMVSEFVEFLRPRTIVGRFGEGGIPSLRRVPFNIRVAAQIDGGSANWVGEGLGKPVTKFGFDAVTLRWNKVAAISVLSEELLRHSTPSAELLVRNSLAEAIVERLDVSFSDKDFSGAADVSPASPFAGASNAAVTGITAASVRHDIRVAVTHFITNNIPLSGLVILMRTSQALSLSLMRNALGVKEFPDMTMNGGLLEGIPVIASQHVKAGIVSFVSADDVYLADDGGVAIDMSREASLEMTSSPTMSMGDAVGSPYVPTPAQLVSMFQTNSVAIRAERIVTWKKRRTAAAYYLTGSVWGNADVSPPADPI
jgi:HK97 family phage major capsid protein